MHKTYINGKLDLMVTSTDSFMLIGYGVLLPW